MFNIVANNYRLVTAIDYKRQIIFIIGTHEEYDKIDAATVQYDSRD